MDRGSTLEAVLEAWATAPGAGALTADAAAAVLAMAPAAKGLAGLIAAPPLAGRLGAAAGGVNSDGDAQRKLDIEAEDLFRGALAGASVAAYLSEEVEAPLALDPAGRLAIAIDPLDGSSNIDVNAPIGTIFSILPALSGAPAASFRQTGRAQVGAGFFVYGPQTALVVSLGQGAAAFVLDPASGEFVLTEPKLAIPPSGGEYAINASNSGRWRAPVRGFIDDCLAGEAGPHGRAFNMRWIASLVADAYRIFLRGGVFLYPADDRPGYGEGRLRLMYEANPIAYLAEQAGGAATDGADPILDRVPMTPHGRSPLVMGSADLVERVRRGHLEREAAG